MRILVFGAGVLGCNLANNLFRAGKDVTLLARGSWAEEIRTNGLRIKNKFSPCLTVSRVPVVTALLPEDSYDVIFVVVRYTQIDAIPDTLRASLRRTSSLSATMCVQRRLPRCFNPWRSGARCPNTRSETVMSRRWQLVLGSRCVCV